MAGTLFAGTLWNGEVLVRNIPVSSGSASVMLGSAGSIHATVQLPLRDPLTGVAIPFADLIVPGRCFLGYEENGFIVNSGPIWSDQSHLDTGAMVLTAAGLRSYFDHRFVLPVLNDTDDLDTPVGKTTKITGTSLRTIAKRLVQQAQAWTAGSVPMVYEADFPGDNEREYKGEELHILSEKLKQLSEVENGPDIDFRARFKTDPRFIEWVMVTGDPELKQSGPDHVWDLTVPVPAIRGVQIVRNGAALVTDKYEIGEQVGEMPLMAKSYDATLPLAGYVRFEDASNRSSVGSLSVLYEHAWEATFVGRYHEQVWTFEANKHVAPRIGDYNVGDYAVMVIKNNPRMPDGRYRLRILSLQASAESNFVQIACAPERIRA